VDKTPSQGALSVVAFVPELTNCADLIELSDAVAKINASAAVVVPLATCTVVPARVRLTVDLTGELARSYGTEGKYLGVLIDQQRKIRRIVRKSDTFAGDLKAWHEGKAIYDAQCARCHGADGADTSYPGTKPLAGIGRRMSEAEILESTLRTGVVDLSALDEQQRRAISIYVAGL
jgi:cytochrome c553